jgi:Uma2 family endonuclease
MQLAEPVTRRWTRAEFHEMAERGWFHGQRAELLEGDIVVQSPQKPLHYTTTERVADSLSCHFGAGFHVRMQGPLDLGEHSEPEPDVAVVAGTREDYAAQHPRTAALLVEVSDTTLANDRQRKGSLYARAQIADYWIVNLVHRQIEVYRNPMPDSAHIYGFRYADQLVLSETDFVQPLAAPHLSIPVNELLP